MFRLLFFLGSALSFSRDYLFSYQDITSLVFTVFFIEVTSDIIIKPFYLRALRLPAGHNIYFHPKFACTIAAAILIVALAISTSLTLFPVDLIQNDIIFILPLASLFRYLSYNQLIKQRFYTFYGLDVARAALWFLFFYSKDLATIYFGMVVLTSIHAVATFPPGRPPARTGLSRSAGLLLIVKRWRQDLLIQVQAVVTTGSALIDKPLIHGAGAPILLFLLVQKFVIFSASVVGSVILQVWQVRATAQKGTSLQRSDMIRDNGWVIVPLALGYFVFFGIVVWYLPVAARLISDWRIVALGGLLLLLTLARDFLVRWEYVTGRISRVGIALILSYAWYTPAVWAFDWAREPVAALALLCAASGMAVILLAITQARPPLRRLPAPVENAASGEIG